MTETKLAWLAGLFDGEGSIGISRHSPAGSWRALVQMSMTSRETIEETIRILREMGITAIGYTYQERDAVNHQDAHYLRVARLADIDRLAKAMLAYSVTKKCHWAVMLAFTTSRLQLSEVGSDGRLRRGGDVRTMAKPFTDADRTCIVTLKRLNRRGAAAKEAAYA
jgi:hypothetical protein